ncbi:LicD family protein [Roseibacillus ishigakijimensis]|nr:LicD family protein [Roseibacillus ishigakijimensis]
MLAEAPVATWRFLDTWSSSPEKYCALQANGWGTKKHLKLWEWLQRTLALKRAEGRPEHLWGRDFLTEVLHPLLAGDGYLSVMLPGTPPARHWVALDIEYCQKKNSASEFIILPRDSITAGDKEQIPTLHYKGYEMPMAGVVSCHQGWPLFSPELEAVHKTLLTLLGLFHRYAEEEGIRYSLQAANLTSYYVSGGFLPWDDDIDLLIHPEDFPKIRALWVNACKPKNIVPRHRGFSNNWLRYFEREGVKLEIFTHDPSSERQLMKWRLRDSDHLFPNDVGGLDLVTFIYKEGAWRDSWSPQEERPNPALLESAVEDAIYQGVTTRAFRREAVEDLMRKKYPFDWSKHPSLSNRERKEPCEEKRSLCSHTSTQAQAAQESN